MKPQPTAQPQMKASDGTPPSLLVRLRRQVRQSSAGSWRLAKSLRRPAFRATICTLLLPSLCLPLSTYANPSGGQVVAGAATISGSGSSLTITQGSHRAIINWQDFSIGAGQTTSFVQPSADSAALNRVLGGNPSAIHGQLNATGQVYLINPNGVLVGPGGVVNTAGFLASTLDVSDQDFLRGGDMTFKGGSNAAVINLGSITAAEGDVILIARQVENHGDIDAPRGTVGLGAGSEVLLKAGGEERMFVRPDSGSSDASVNQAGKIRAATVELKAAGGNEYSLAIKHGGETRATGVAKRGGRVFLSAGGKGGIVNTGTIVARKSSGRGGSVRVEADKVTLGSGSKIDVSGANGKGGGEVLVGGGYQGKDATIRNASSVEAEMGSLIIADGDGPGNGGRVILWSDERTSFGGEILARGGSGGFVEVSGKSLNFNGNVNTGGGILLLDPVNLTIFSGNTGSVGDDNLGDDVITGLLGSNNLTLTADNQITVQGDVEIDWAADTTLTLNAGRNIVVQSGAVIRSTYAGANFDAIVMNADGGAGGSNYGIAVQSNAILETHSGNIVLDGKGLQYGVFMSGTIRSNGIGKIDITGETTGNVAQGAGVIVQTDAASGFALVTSVDGDITIEGIGGGTGMRKRGILLTTNNTAGRTAVIESTGDARITMTGSGSTDATNQGNSGVYLQGEGAEVRSAHGDIAITGTGGDSSAANQFGNHGVGLESGARIVSSDDANITITGTAGGGSGLEWSSGVSVGEGLGSGGALSQIVTNNGHLIIHGVGSTSTSSKDDNHGIEFQAAGALVNNGIGSISLTGVSSNGDAGIRFGGATTVGGASAGDITLTADSIDVGAGNLTLQGSKELRIQQYTSTATIGVGNGATGDLALSNTVLDGIQDGFSHIYIGGETATGGVDIRGYAFKDSVTIQAPGGDGNIEVRGTLSTPTAGDSITLRAGGGITTFANARITTQNGAIGFFADTDDSGSGNIVFNGNGGNPAIDANASIVVNANGGSITLAGGSDGSGYAVGRTSGGGTNLSGISMHGTSLLTTGDITLRGKGAGQNGLSGDRQGISLSGGSVIGQTDGTGAISLTGLGGNTGANQRQGIGSGGSYNGSKVKTGTGAVKLTGTGGAGGVGGGSGNNAGLALSAITIESTGGAGAGKIELTGEAGNTAGNNTGTSLGQVTISSVDADIDIKGTGGIAGSNGAPSHGLTVGNGASITSSGAGSIELSGTATSSSGHGVLFTGTGNEVAAAAGNLTVTGVSVGASYRDIMVGTGSYTLGNAATTGNITVNADRANFGGGNLAMQSDGGELRIQQNTAGTSIGVGDGAAGTLHLSDADLAAIEDGFSEIIIGRSDGTGAITVNTGNEFQDSLRLLTDGTGGTVAINSDLSVGTGNGNRLVLVSGGTVATASQITADGLRLAGTADYSLTNTDNRIGTVAKGTGDATGSVVIHNGQTLAVGTVYGASGLNGSTVEVQVGTGNLVLNSAVNASATGEGNVALSVADGSFINNVGGGAIGTNGGTWKIYLPSPDGHTFGNLASGNHAIYGRTIGSMAPGAAPTGHRYLFANTPVLDITSSFGDSKTYGDAYTFTALVEGVDYQVGYVDAAAYGSVFLQDTAASVGLSGLNTLAFASLGQPANANVGVYDIDFDHSGVFFNSLTGYAMGAYDSTGKLTVGQRNVTVTVDPNQRKTYGAADPLAYTFAYSDLGGGVALSGLLTRDSGDDAGTYDITEGTLINANNPNYNITFVGDVFTIDKATLNVFATPGQSKVYGNADPIYAYTHSGLVNGDTASVFGGALDRATGENVGNYAINQGNLNAGGNYTINFTGANFAITPAALSVAAIPGQSKVYGSANPVYAYTYSGLVNGDTASVFGGALDRATGENVGNYAINQGNLSAGGNYTINFTGANFAITPAALSVFATPGQSKVYGSANPVYAYTYSGLVNGDTDAVFGGVLDRATGENVGNYAINQGNLSAGGNYTINFTGADFEITKATLNVLATPGSKIYGNANPIYAYTYSGLTNGDDDSVFGGALDRAAGENVGNYAINQGDLTAGGNYTINFTGADFEITQRAITIGSNSGQTKVYGDDDPSGLAGQFGVTGGLGLATGDSLAGSMGRAVGEDVGSYDFTRNTVTVDDGNGGLNYAITFDGTTNQFSITPRSGLTASIADQSKTYGEADPAIGGIGVSLGGLVNRTVSTINGNVVLNDTGNVGATLASLDRDSGENVNSYAYTAATFNPLTGTAADNYAAPTFQLGSVLEIGKRAITVRAGSGSSIYGDTPVNPGISLISGTTTAFGHTLADLGLGNDFALVYNSNAGTYTINVTQAGGALAANYDIGTETGLFTIGKRDITLGSNAGLTKMYGEDDPTGLASEFGVTVGSLVAGDVLSGAMTREAGENVGSRYFIRNTAGITTAKGGDNYNIAFDGTTHQLAITARTGLTASIANQSKIYGENDPAIGGIGVTLGGLVNGTVNTINGAVSLNDIGNVATTLASLTRDSGENVNSYAYTAATFNPLAGSAAGNYAAPTFQTGSVLNIGKRAITLTADTASKTYGEADPASYSASVTGGMGLASGLGDTLFDVTGTLTREAGQNVGAYDVYLGTGTKAGNYDITFNTNNDAFTITPRAITIGSNVGLSKMYGDDDPSGLASQYAVTGGLGLVGTDSLSGLMLREAGEGVGSRNFLRGSVGVSDGNGGNNYAITFDGTTNQFTITQRTGLTASIANQSKIYGDADPAIGGIGVTLGGLVNRTVQTINGAVSLNDTGNVATALASLDRVAGENANQSYAYTGATFNALTGSASGNYAAPTFQAGSSLTIGRRAITLTADTASKIYGDGDPGFSVQVTGGSLAGALFTDDLADVTGVLGREAGQNVGLYSILLGTGSKADNYDITFDANNKAFSITPASLTITANNQTKTFGDTFTFAGSEFTPTGLQNGESIGSVTLASGGAVNTAGVNGSPYTITIGGATGGSFDINNYAVTYVNGNLTVTPRDITVTALGGTSVYGQSPANPGLTATNLASFDTVAALTGLSNSFGITPTTAAGTYGLTVAGALANPNYNVTSTSGNNWIVTQKALTITARNQSKTYGDAFSFNPAYDGVNGHYTVDGLINGDSVSTADLASLGAANTATVNGGTPYDITIGNAVGTGLGNYHIDYVDGGLTVTPRNITVTANGGNSTYGDAPSNPGLTASNLASFDNVSALTGLSNSFGINALTNAGSHALTVDGMLSNENYHVTQLIGGTWVVNPKGVVVTALGGSSTYGGTPPNPGLSATGLVNGQNVSVLTGLYNSFGIGATTAAGDHPLYVLGTLTNGNYKVDGLVNGNWHVNQKALTIAANNLSKTYGDAYTFVGNEFTTSGLINGDSVGWASISSGGAAATATVAGSPYIISIGGALGSGLSNYAITYQTGLFTIDKRALMVTANNLSKTYGDAYTFVGNEFTTSGLVNTDSVTSATLSSAGAAATASVGGSPYTISIGGAVGSGLDNYDISYTTGLFTVDQRTLTITANNLTKIYGDTLNFTGSEFTPTGLQNGETIGSVTLASAGAVNTATVPGSPYAIVASNAVGGTFDIGNYAVTYVNGALTVNKRDITVTANGGSSTYGDSPANPGLSATNLASFDTGANVSALLGLSNSFGITATTNAGTHTLNVLGTVSNPNYNVTDRISGTWTVGQRALTITANNQTKTYGDTFTFAGSEFTPTGLQNGETIGSVTLTSAGAVNTATVPGSPYAIVASNAVGGTFNINNYAVTYVNGALTVNKRDITVTALGGSSIYGDSPTNPGLGATNLASFDTVAALTGLYNSFGITSTTAAGNHTLTVAGALTNPNYNVTQFNTGTWTVGQRALTITADNQTKTYGDTFTFAGTEFGSSGLQNGETIGSVTLTSAGAVNTATVSGGPYAIVGSGATGGTFDIANYDVTYVDGQLTVTPRQIEVTAVGGSSIYGDSPANPGISADNMASFEVGQENTLLTGLYNSFGIGATTPAGDHALHVLGTLTNGNYEVVGRIDGNWHVGTKQLDITANDQSRIYGDSFAFNGTEFTSVGLINGDQVNWVGLASAATNEQLGVGTYAITASGALGTGLSNYHILYHGGSFTVTPRKVTVTANGGSSVYGQSPANPGLSADNLAHFDGIADLTGLYNSFGITSTTGAGVYTLNVLGTLTNPNYDVIGRVPGIWTVGQAALTITPHQAFRFVHQPNPPFSVFANGFQPGDGFWSLGGDLGYLTDANYYSLAGEYAVYPTGVNAANYNITFTQGTLTVVDNPMLLKDMANPIQFLQTKDDEEEKDAEKGEIRYEERKAEEKVISTLSTGDLQASAE